MATDAHNGKKIITNENNTTQDNDKKYITLRVLLLLHSRHSSGLLGVVRVLLSSVLDYGSQVPLRPDVGALT